MSILYAKILALSMLFAKIFAIQRTEQMFKAVSTMFDLERLNELIETSGKTRTYLCRRMGKPVYFITNIFRRRTEVPPDVQEALAEALDTTVEYLNGETDDPRPQKRGVKIPVYGQVAAGIPIDAITDIEDYEEITAETAAGGEYAALRIHGDSMEPRIWDGDTVIVRLQNTAETGDTAIVIINGDSATCKKIKKTPEGVLLVPLNQKYEPLFYTNAEIETLPVLIWGKVVEVRGTI